MGWKLRKAPMGEGLAGLSAHHSTEADFPFATMRFYQRIACAFLYNRHASDHNQANEYTIKQIERRLPATGHTPQTMNLRARQSEASFPPTKLLESRPAVASWPRTTPRPIMPHRTR